MRLWTLHPRYLDSRGLVALWREALLAQAVLCDRTRGYRRHPQLVRFQLHAVPEAAIDAYLRAVHEEAAARGYAFDARKIGAVRMVDPIAAMTGQLAYEWDHLLAKLAMRGPNLFRRWRREAPEPHPLFTLVEGPTEPWEKAQRRRAR